MRRIDRERLATLGYAAIGACVFSLLGLPLPFLFGPMAACLIAALAGQTLAGMGQVGTAARTILGVAIGCSITPDLVERIPAMAVSVALIPLYVVIIAAVGIPYFYRFRKLDFTTAYYAAMPGGLQDMVIFGAEAGGNARALSLIHATRVLFIVTLAPILITSWFGAGLSHPMGEPVADQPLSELAIMAAAALIGWKVGERIGLFGASILGPMIATAALALTDVLHHRPPAEAVIAAQYFIGMGIGVYYVGITFREIRHLVASGVLYVLLLAVLAAAFAEAVTLLGLAPPMEAFLAFAPGGQAEMVVLAIVAGADLGFVIIHHLIRVVLVITLAPLAAKLLGVPTVKKAVTKSAKPPD